ncbi:hypothetical protein ABXT06_17390 [Flavobacterium sp. UW10123]|uniref:hypothetical protein n=1 Tax=Flavobacterium sp. UW10123 TaxID=3230800 RepID=UPI003393DDB5
MSYLLLALFIVIVNCSIFYFLKSENGLKKILLYALVYFIIALIFTKIYILLDFKAMPNDFGFFLLLMFSWTMILMHFIKNLNNRRVNIAKRLQMEDNQLITPSAYLTFIVISVTAFQLYLILSKTINVFRS